MPEAQDVLIKDQPCRQFIEQSKAQTTSVVGASRSEKR